MDDQVRNTLEEILFQISNPMFCVQAKELRSWGAEGVIVGSALVKILGQAKSQEEGIKELRSLAASLRSAIWGTKALKQRLKNLAFRYILQNAE